MDFENTVLDAEVVLTEGAVVEWIKRDSPLQLDPYILHAGFVFDSRGREVLAGIYREYLDIGTAHDLPMIVGTPTWRANPERVGKATDLSCDDVNRGGVEFLEGIRSEYGEYADKVFIGALIGPKGDAYDPSDSPSVEQAADFHQTQIQTLASTGADFLMAATLPSAQEAVGMAMAMGATGAPYILSFVLRPTGCLLDGTPLSTVVAEIDSLITDPPLCYMANCVHPTVFREAMGRQMELDVSLDQRVLGLQANTSALPPEALDGCVLLQGEDPLTFADLMVKLYVDSSIGILGGCCGTGPEHIRALAERFNTEVA